MRRRRGRGGTTARSVRHFPARSSLSEEQEGRTLAGATPVWWLCAIPRVWRAVCWRTWRKVVRAALRANMAAGKRAKRLVRIERRAAGGPQDEGESRKRASAMGLGGGDDLDRGRPTACAELRLGTSAVERYPQGLQHSQEARNEVCVRVLRRGGRRASLFALADDDVDEPTRLDFSPAFRCACSPRGYDAFLAPLPPHKERTRQRQRTVIFFARPARTLARRTRRHRPLPVLAPHARPTERARPSRRRATVRCRLAEPADAAERPRFLQEALARPEPREAEHARRDREVDDRVQVGQVCWRRSERLERVDGEDEGVGRLRGGARRSARGSTGAAMYSEN